MKAILAVASCAMVVVAIAAGGNVLRRIDRARAEARSAYEHASAAHASQVSVVQHQNVVALELQQLDGQLAACRQRTDHLRNVLEILVSESAWDERVKLPNPPPGWAAWPPVGHYWDPHDHNTITDKGGD